MTVSLPTRGSEIKILFIILDLAFGRGLGWHPISRSNLHPVFIQFVG